MPTTTIVRAFKESPGHEEISPAYRRLRRFAAGARERRSPISACAGRSGRAVPRYLGLRPLRRLHRHEARRRQLPRLVLAQRLCEAGVDETARAGSTATSTPRRGRLFMRRAPGELSLLVRRDRRVPDRQLEFRHLPSPGRSSSPTSMRCRPEGTLSHPSDQRLVLLSRPSTWFRNACGSALFSSAFICSKPISVLSRVLLKTLSVGQWVPEVDLERVDHELDLAASGLSQPRR